MSAFRGPWNQTGKWGILMIVLAGISALSLVGLADETPPPKNPPQRTEEEDDDPPPTKKKKGTQRQEEEDDDPTPARRPAREVRRLDDEDKAEATTKAPKPIDSADLPDHPRVKELLSQVNTQADEILLREFSGVKIDSKETGGNRLRVELLPRYFFNLKEEKESLQVQLLDANGERGDTRTVEPRLIQTIRYHEQLAAEQVRNFLNAGYHKRLTTDSLYLSRPEQYLVAQQALSRLLNQHESNEQRGLRQGRGWDRIKAELRRELLAVRLEQLRLLVDQKDYDGGFQLAGELIDEFTAPSEQQSLAEAIAPLLAQAQNDTNYPADRLARAQQRLRALEGRFARSELYRPIAERLREQARTMLERAQQLVKQEKHAEALAVLKQAEETYPELPGLRTYRIEIDQSYRILRVGMRELPRYLSPGWAMTDADRRAVELLFESLVTLVPDENGLLTYRPMLAEGRPRVLSLGRQFQLPRQAFWSDGKPLSVGDLRASLAHLQRGGATGRSPGWGKLFPERGAVEALDQSRVKLRLQQGTLNPLEAMAFKLLPSRVTPPADSEAFALKPVCSGPFQFAGSGKEADGQDFVRFKANPYYGIRSSRRDLPRIKEIRILAPADPVKALLNTKSPSALDLVTDLTAEQAAELEKAGCEVPLPRTRGANRRVYFLAVNHRRTPLALVETRMALTRAINREALLDDVFRKGLGRRVHHALNGPYPAGSWALHPTLVSRTDPASLDPFDSALARSKWKQALAKLRQTGVKLSLSYPRGDAQVEAAMQALCERVSKELKGLELVPVSQTVADLRQQVEQTHSYDLAYYHYDFPDEGYWLYPLLGPVGLDGNCLGYTGPLVNQLQMAESIRNFSQLREYTQAIHRQFLEQEVPMVPLWQLDPLYAFRSGGLELPPIDPLTLFTRVEEWRVRR